MAKEGEVELVEGEVDPITGEPIKKVEPGVEKTAPELETLTKSITDLNSRIKELEHESSGKEADLREERRLRQQLEDKIKQAEGKVDELGLGDLKDDDYLTAGAFKKALLGLTKVMDQGRKNEQRQRAEERMADDESRMMGRADLDVPYEEALDEFKRLTKQDPSLWEDVNREANRPGGRPAEKAYKIALRESPKYRGLERKKGREEIVKQIDETGKVPSLKGGGGGDRPKDLSKMTDEDISKLSDADLDALLKKSG